MRSAITRRAVAALPLAALGAPIPAIAGLAAGDARLVKLGQQWRAFADQRDAYFDIEKGLAVDDPRHEALDTLEGQIYEQQATIEEAIFNAPATSMAALAVKARLLARLNDVGPLDAAGIEYAMRGKLDFSERCALSLALDIVRLGETEKLS